MHIIEEYNPVSDSWEQKFVGTFSRTIAKNNLFDLQKWAKEAGKDTKYRLVKVG